MTLSCLTVNNRLRLYQAPLLCGAFIFFLLLAGALQPALAASPVTGVTVSPATAAIHSGQAVYVRATVQGTGDYDHRVNWSLTPSNAGNLSPTGLFISAPAFTGAATVTATSVESSTFSAAAAITVSAGAGVVHVDRNNLAPGTEDGTALHPWRTIQGAIDHGETIKVAQGTYTESVGLPGASGVLILGGFKGGSAADYAAGVPGDFVTRSTDHVTQVTTIQSPDRSTLPVVGLGNWGSTTSMTYAVDGFTVTGGFHGFDVQGNGPVTFFISQNLIYDNGVLQDTGNYVRGGGIKAEGVNILVLNNRIANNLSEWGGGLYIGAMANSFLIQGNLIENNQATSGLGGGGGDFGQDNLGQGTGLFTWNIVRGNRSGVLVTGSPGGGVNVGGGPLELSHNVYANNKAKHQGGGVFISDGTTCVLRHELIYKNRVAYDSGGAGLHAQGNSVVTVDHCTITGNVNSPGNNGNGIYLGYHPTVGVSNSIIWGNSGDQLYVTPGGAMTVTYSDSQPYAGAGNLSVDPLFANPATDDYHVKSLGGRYDPALSQWVTDRVHSPCIDAGDPAAAFDQEPTPNRSRTNMGVYGNTPKASKSRASLEAILQLLLLGD